MEEAYDGLTLANNIGDNLKNIGQTTVSITIKENIPTVDDEKLFKVCLGAYKDRDKLITIKKL